MFTTTAIPRLSRSCIWCPRTISSTRRRLKPCPATQDSNEQTRSLLNYLRFRKVLEKRGNITTDELFESYITNLSEILTELESPLVSEMLKMFEGLGVDQFAMELSEDFKLWLNDSIQSAKDMQSNQIRIPTSQFWSEQSGKMSPRMQFIIANVGAANSAFVASGISLLGFGICKLVGLDVLKELEITARGLSYDWLLWLGPYACSTYLFWNADSLDNWKPVQAFKKVIQFKMFRLEIIDTPENYADFGLLLKALGHACKASALYQGALLAALVGHFTDNLTFSDTGFAGVPLRTPIPATIVLPAIILVFGVIVAVLNMLGDLSLYSSVEKDAQDPEFVVLFDTYEPRTGAQTPEDFELLDNREVTRDRAWLTFCYYSLSFIYISAETIALKSLYASTTTLAIGYYIMLKGIRKYRLQSF